LDNEQTSGDAVPVDDNATTENNSVPAQETESSGDNNELAELKELLSSAVSRMDGMSRKVGALEVQVKKASEQTKTPAQEASKPKDTGITAERRELEQLKAELNRDKVLTSLESALSKVGALRPDKFVEVVEKDLGDRIKVDGRHVVIEDGGENVSVLDYVQAYVKTDAGSWMIPPKQAGTQSLTSTTTEASRKKVTIDDLNRMSPDELKNGSFDVQM